MSATFYVKDARHGDPELNLSNCNAVHFLRVLGIEPYDEGGLCGEIAGRKLLAKLDALPADNSLLVRSLGSFPDSFTQQVVAAIARENMGDLAASSQVRDGGAGTKPEEIAEYREWLREIGELAIRRRSVVVWD